MKRTNKRAVKAATTDPGLTNDDAFPVDGDVVAERHAHDQGDDLFHQDEETEEAPADEDAPVAAEGEAEDTHADNALGLYLRQMGAIPLLNRDQEIALAKRLEMRRSRYRHAAMASWRTLDEVVQVFEHVLAEELARSDHRRGQDAGPEPRRNHEADAAQRQDAASPDRGVRRRLPHAERAVTTRPASACAATSIGGWQGHRAGRRTVAAHRPARPLDR